MGISVQIDSKIDQNRKKLDKLFMQNAVRHVNRVAVYFQNEVKRGMQRTPKTGEKYRKGKKIHIASSEGNPPAIDTGRLVSSILVSNATGLGAVPVAKVKTNVEYAYTLDKGNLNRPFMSKNSTAYQKARLFSQKIMKNMFR